MKTEAEFRESMINSFNNFIDKYYDSLYPDITYEEYQARQEKQFKKNRAFVKWMLGDMKALMSKHDIELKDLKFNQSQLWELVELEDNNTINGKQAKEIFEEMFLTGVSPNEIVRDKNISQIADSNIINTLVDKVISENSAVVAQYKSGKTGVLGFLVGKIMKETQGKANPKLVSEILVEKLK